MKAKLYQKTDENLKSGANQKEDSAVKLKSKMNSLEKIAIVLILCALSFPFAKDQWDAWFGNDKELRNPSIASLEGGEVIDLTASSEAIQRALAALSTKANADQAKIWEKFKKDLKAVQLKNRQEALLAMNKTSEELLKVSSIRLLLSDFVQDKSDGGNRAQGHMEVYMKPFVKSLQEANIRVNDLLNRLEFDLEALNNQYAMQVGEIIEEQKSVLPKSKFEKLALASEVVPQKLANQVGSASVAVVVEGVFIRSTAVATKSVYVLLTEKMAPLVGKCVISGTLPAMDGPLPILDIIAVATAAWTVYDVVNLSGDIRDDVRTELHTVRQSYLDELEKSAKKVSEEKITKAIESRKSLRENVESQL